jgi:hypothetical protein
MGSIPVAATNDVMRVLAHDLRQPLGTIESIAYYLTLIVPEDDKVHEQLHRIRDLVEQSNWMLTSVQLLSDPVPPADGFADVSEVAAAIDFSALDLQCDDPLPPVSADAALVRALLENLAVLFRQFPGRSLLRIYPLSGGIRFDFSSRAACAGEASLGPGSSLSLQGVRRIAEALGGSLETTLDSTLDASIEGTTGTRARLWLPQVVLT